MILTLHAICRMSQRGLSSEGIKNTILYGFEKSSKDGRYVYNLTRSIVRKLFKQENIDILKYEGMRVILTENNEVLTAYKCNHNKRSSRDDNKRLF